MLIDYKSNYNKIIELVRNHFSLTNSSMETFEKVFLKGAAVEDFSYKLDENFRLERPLSIKDIESIDESWMMFKFYFGEYCVDTGITYQEYLLGNRTNQKNISKLSKDLKKFYTSKNTVFMQRVGMYGYGLDDLIQEINNVRLPRKKLKAVLTFNLSDMFMCSTGQDWTSCLNLESEYSGVYSYGLASLPFDKNRGMVYISSRNDNQTESFGITSEKMYKRSFFLVDEADRFNILKWYPAVDNFNTTSKLMNDIFPFEFKDIDSLFIPKHSLELPEMTSDGNTYSFYIYQDKTEIDKISKRIIYSGGKGNQYFLNEENNFGQFINCKGGLRRIISEGKEIKDFAKGSFTCESCRHNFSEDERNIVEGRSLCYSCFDDYAVYCESCGEYVLSENFNFEERICHQCYDNIVEESIY